MIPFWKWVPADIAHHLAPTGVRFCADIFGQDPNHSDIFKWSPLNWMGLNFPNRVGLAGGVDKNADCLQAWPKLGFGFVEIGTITARPQRPNPGKILARDWDKKTLWNKMGFPNDGAKELRARLDACEKIPVPLFINIGKNRETSLTAAYEDYVFAAKELENYADAFVVNISSPNTQNLRELQSKKYLTQLIEKLKFYISSKPILLKISPDLHDSDLHHILDVASTAGINGFILTNTTTKRPENNSQWPVDGGLSGKALAQISSHALTETVNHFKNSSSKPLIISVGGILSDNDITSRLESGADLVQVYSALVFSGPLFALNFAKKISKSRVDTIITNFEGSHV